MITEKKELQWTSTFCDYDHKCLNGKVDNLLYYFLLECGLLKFISRKFAHTWQVKPDGIIGVKFERTRIHFQCCRSGCVNFQILSTRTVPLFTHICLCYIMFFTLFYFRTKVLRTKYEGYIIPLQKKPALLKNPTEGLDYSCIKQHLVSHCIGTYLGSHKNEPFWKITFSVGSTHLQHRIDNYFVLKTVDSFLFQLSSK